MRTPNNVTRNTLRRLAFTLFAAVMGCVTTWADSWTSGDCTVTLEGATLTVTKNSGDGNGAMADYTYSNEGGRGWKSSLSVVTSIVIESGVTTIGDYSFSGFNKLTSVTIPASVTSIGQLAFNGCTSLTSVTLLEGMKNIGNSAFNYCTGLSTVTIPEGVETIGNSAFRQCTSLGAVTIPESVTRIGEYAFYSCSNLARVIISNGVTIIDNYAFQQCTSLTSVFIPVSVTEVGQQAFSGCSNLASVTILTKSLTRFGSSAFDNNASGRKIYVFANYLSTLGTSQNSWKKYKDAGDITALPTDGTHGDNIKYSLFDCDFDNTKETLVISGSGDMTEDLYYNLDKGTITNAIIENGVTSIGKYAFYNCIHLASITIPASVTSIDRDAFKGCWSLVSLNIPASVTSIGQGAFIYCTGLTSVTIPTSVTSIGNSAFESCTALTSVFIPSSVTSIGQSTFYNCTSLTSVTINGNPRMGPQAFPSNATVSLNLTANSAGGANWMTFYNDLYRFQADANTTVYKGTISDNRLMLTEVADKIVNVGTAVILKSMGNPVMTLASTNSSNMNTNDLKGVMEDTDTPPNCYTLANESEGLGFYQYTGEKIHAGKAYIIYNGGTSREFIGLDSDAGDGDATRLKEERINNKEIKSEWYMLSGARLSGKPTAKGIYIVKGRKVIR